MRLLISPDKFKDSLTAPQAADAIADGVRQAFPHADLDLCPLADGGEGTVEALARATGGTLVTRTVTGPLPHTRVAATFALLGPDGATAAIEMASASGLHLLPPDQRNPMRTTTYGTGELMMAAAELGAKHILLGIGGSATNDAGIGAAQACGGVPVLDDGAQQPLARPFVGADLPRFLWQTWDDRFARFGCRITVACDVANPLHGPQGAARVFAPQKGASPAEVDLLDAALQRLAQTLRSPHADTPGAGAAGGMGFGMLAFFQAELRPGIELVLDAVRFADRLARADLCLTGEGRLDASSLLGKAPVGVARACHAAGVPCVALAGAVDLPADAELPPGLTAIFPIAPSPMPLPDALARAAQHLARAARNAAALFAAASTARRGR